MNYLLIPAFSWLAAQGLKYLGELFGSSKKKQSSLMPSPLVLSGGMPSAHSATVTSLTVAVGYYEGIYSAIFAISLLFSSVVMYDAMMVRYSSGRQGGSRSYAVGGAGWCCFGRNNCLRCNFRNKIVKYYP